MTYDIKTYIIRNHIDSLGSYDKIILITMSNGVYVMRTIIVNTSPFYNGPDEYLRTCRKIKIKNILSHEL